MLMTRTWSAYKMKPKANTHVWKANHCLQSHLKLLQLSTTPTMFFPISWTSPFTVARTMVPIYGSWQKGGNAGKLTALYWEGGKIPFYLREADQVLRWFWHHFLSLLFHKRDQISHCLLHNTSWLNDLQTQKDISKCNTLIDIYLEKTSGKRNSFLDL